MFVGGPNERKDYHIEEGEEVKLNCLVYACAYLGQLVRVYHTVFLLHLPHLMGVGGFWVSYCVSFP